MAVQAADAVESLRQGVTEQELTDAAHALATLAVENEAKAAAIIAAGAAPVLVQLLGHSSSDVQAAALRVLRSLADGSKSNEASIWQAGAAPAIVRLLGRSSSEQAADAVAAVKHFLHSEAGNDAFAAAGAQTELLQLLGSSSSSSMQEDAAAALFCLATGEREASWSAAVAEGIAHHLVQLLELSHASARYDAGFALAALAAGSVASKDAVQGCLPDLIQLLHHERLYVREAAAAALRCLAVASKSVRAAIVAECAAPALVQLLRDSSISSGALTAAAGVLCLLADDSEAGRDAVLAADAMESLVQLLGHSSSDGDVQERAAAVLANLAAGSEDNKAAVVEAGALEPLVWLLGHSRSSDVQERVTAVLANLAAGSETVKAAVVAAGAVPVLRLRDDSRSSPAVQEKAAAALKSLGVEPATAPPAATLCSEPSSSASGSQHAEELAAQGATTSSSGTAPPTASFVRSTGCRTVQFDQLNFRRSCCLGYSSFGKVYLAEWEGTPVAVKVLLELLDGASGSEVADTQPEKLEKLQRGCALLAGITHPNIVQFLCACDRPPAIVTEYCRRGSLHDVLQRARGLPAREALLSWQRRLGMALDAACGIMHMHNRGIAHRDLKSPSLLVDAGWRVKVAASFWLSTSVEGYQFGEVPSDMEFVNPIGQAPEVLRGDPVTSAAQMFANDAYSFGYVLWELMTWERPWKAVSRWNIVQRKLNGGHLAIPPPEEYGALPGTEQDRAAFSLVAAHYTQLIGQCWADNHFDRPGFAAITQQLKEMLEALPAE